MTATAAAAGAAGPPAFPRTFSLQLAPRHPAAAPRDGLAAATAAARAYPHKPRRKRWLTRLRATGTYALFLLIFIALLASLVDFGHAIIYSDRSSKASDLIIGFGSYAAVIVFGIGMAVARRIANNRAEAAIPKAYVPTQVEDVPKRAFRLIKSEFDRACIITKVHQPRGRTQAGWGRPGTASENVHFRSAILSTVPALRAALEPLVAASTASRARSTGPGQLGGGGGARSGPISPLAPFLLDNNSDTDQDTRPLIPDALRPLAELYERHLVKAKYAKEEPTEQEWDEAVKAVAVFVGVLTTTTTMTAAAAAGFGSERRSDALTTT